MHRNTHLSVVPDAEPSRAEVLGIQPGCDVAVFAPSIACLCEELYCRHTLNVMQAQPALHAAICSCGGTR